MLIDVTLIRDHANVAWTSCLFGWLLFTDVVRQATCNLSVPSHALNEPASRTYSTGRTFIHFGVQIWNVLPESAVDEICANVFQVIQKGFLLPD